MLYPAPSKFKRIFNTARYTIYMEHRSESDIRNEMVELVLKLHHSTRGNFDSDYADELLHLYDLCCELEEYYAAE